MKRIYKAMSLAAAVILFSQCAFREQDAPAGGEGVQFELFALSPSTKTVNDGLSTKWVVGDKISVWHSVHGGKTYYSDGLFEIDDAEKGHAIGTVSELSSGKYDWFLFYPGSEKSQNNPGGDIRIAAQPSQEGYDSKAHLAGPDFPLGGCAEQVPHLATPSVTLHPLLSVIEVHVTNAQAIPARVSSVAFTAPEAISGDFNLSWNGSFTAKGNNSESVSLSVSGGTLLDQSADACLYMGIKPFQASAGSVISLSVTMVDELGREAVQTKEVSLSAATSFKGGTIKTLNFAFSEEFPPAKTYTFRKVTEVKAGHHYLIVADYNGVSYAGLYFDSEVNSGRMPVREVTPVEGVITLSDYKGAYRFVNAGDGWLISQNDGRFLYNNNADNISVSLTPADAGKLWAIEFDSEGLAAITNRTRQIKFNTTSSVMKFQSRLKTSSGLSPALYELENDELYEEEFKDYETIGVYGIEGTNWLYEEGRDQISVLSKSSAISFRLLTPSDYVAIQLTGLPGSISEGEVYSVTLKRFVKLVQSHSFNLEVKVVKVSSDKAWLLSSDGTGIIAKIN